MPIIEQGVFDANPALGITRFSYYDTDKDELIIETKQDVSGMIELAKAKYNSTDERAPWGEGQHVMQVPLALFYRWQQEGRIDDQRELRRLINDPDNRVFRTRPGRV